MFIIADISIYVTYIICIYIYVLHAVVYNWQNTNGFTKIFENAFVWNDFIAVEVVAHSERFAQLYNS